VKDSHFTASKYEFDQKLISKDSNSKHPHCLVENYDSYCAKNKNNTFISNKISFKSKCVNFQVLFNKKGQLVTITTAKTTIQNLFFNFYFCVQNLIPYEKTDLIKSVNSHLVILNI